jgi:exodeoxyribonuclease-1
LNAEETTRFNGYLREKWSADDAPETEWMTLTKARAAIDALHIQEAASVAELDAITTFVEGWSARAFAVAMSESSV